MVKEILNTLTKKGKRSLIISIINFVFYALSGIAMMLIVLNLLNLVITGKQINLVPYWIGLGICLLIKSGSNIVADTQKHFAGFDLVYQIREKITYRLKSLSLGFYTNERLGEISSIIHKDVDNMELVVGHLWTRMCADFIVSVVLVVFFFVIDWKMGLLMISILPFALLLLKKGLRKANNLEEKMGNHLANMVSRFVEYVKGIPLLKAFSNSKKFDVQLEKTISNFGESSKKTSKNKAKVLSTYCFLIDLSYWVMITVGIFLLFAKIVSPMVFLIFVVVGKQFYKPFSDMETHWMNYIKVTDSFIRIKKITEAPIVCEPLNPQTPQNFDIKFNDVSFSYEDGEFKMEHIGFQTPQNTLTALVGESGSGKTTITNLLLRFWDVNSGSIRIGDIDIRNIGYDDLLGSISIVMQNVKLFADTIEGNIRMGKANATKEEIIEAAKKARIHNFIKNLPDGYDTVLGENGAGLSGGQKQRISIARAFLKNAPILILDEITSNVDPVNEALIQEAISELTRNRTVLVVAHHLSTIRSADQILVFKNGKIQESGTHQQLLRKKDSYYNTLWNKKTF